jgi:acyl-CoA synthetase (AMP-forming)/AMP-acid ligase II
MTPDPAGRAGDPGHGQLYQSATYGQLIATALTRGGADEERLRSCGRPCAGVIVTILGKDGLPVPVGDVGELCVRGPLVMSGYWQRPEETAEALRGGWLHTGDLARQDQDGFLYLVGRSTSGGRRPGSCQNRRVGFIFASREVTNTRFRATCRGGEAGNAQGRGVAGIHLAGCRRGVRIERVCAHHVPGLD